VDDLSKSKNMAIRWPDGASFDWTLADWLGLAALLLMIAFVLTVLVALWRGESPLKVLRQIGWLLASVFTLKK
jgi:hypothetical protein